MATPSQKVHPHLSLIAISGALARDEETVEYLRELLTKAEAGQLVGIACAVKYRGGGEYGVRTCGAMDRNPTFARGAVAALSDHLSRRQWRT